jgi:predicted Zn finger-like uncharacterized protein
MKISCQACEAKYTIADEKVQGKVAKIRCKKCGATIVVNGNASGEAAPADGGEGGLVYTVSVSDGDQRTMSVAEIVTAYNSGEITGETYLWADGMDDWLPLASVPAILEALNAAAGEPEPAADPARAASRRDGSRAGFDLFGGGGAAAEPAPAAAAEDPSFDSPMGGGSAAAATGARNEQSVLFSLNALVNAERKSAPPNASKTKDDSGLIDLGALAAKASSEPMGGSMSEPMMPMAPMLGAPLLAPPPVATAAVPTAAAAPPPASKTGMYVGGAIVFATLVGAGVFVATRPKEQPPAPPVVATTAPTATETAPAPTATSTAVDPTAAVTASATATATAAPPRVVGKGTGTKTTAKTADKPPTAAPPATTAAKPPSSGNCGCPPGDLNCAIKCSATKKK